MVFYINGPALALLFPRACKALRAGAYFTIYGGHERRNIFFRNISGPLEPKLNDFFWLSEGGLFFLAFFVRILRLLLFEKLGVKRGERQN